MKKLIFITIIVLTVFNAKSQKNSSAAFEDFKKNPRTAALPDYSWAGYKLGTEAISNVKGRIFDVSKYRAIPNDSIEDFDGVQAAIKAAEEAGGGIVFFPKGRFLMNEQVGRRIGIKISKPNIILRGSGCEPGGTELFMKNYMLPADPDKKWTVPTLFTFSYYQGSSEKALISENAKRGEMKIMVENAAKLKIGDFINLRMQNIAANKEFLDGFETWNNWEVTNQKGVSINERHKIASIDGNEITLCEPLKTNITASYGWKVVTMPLTEGLGVEDIWFRGNFKEKIVHHKDFIHDAGWGFLRMERPTNGFVRRIRLTDVCTGVSIVNGYACSVLHVRFDGNPGHCTVGAEQSYGVLFGFIDDASNAPGMWHGPCTAANSVCTVIWRYNGQARSGLDIHASWPYCTLVDASKSDYMGNGGDYRLLPNHMKDLTYWNHNYIGKYMNVDFWEPQDTVTTDHQTKYFGKFAKAVRPSIIGMYGDSISFVRANLNLYESQGTPVTPESLYEAQLELRLGKLPKWVNEAKKEWKEYLSKSARY